MFPRDRSICTSEEGAQLFREMQNPNCFAGKTGNVIFLSQYWRNMQAQKWLFVCLFVCVFFYPLCWGRWSFSKRAGNAILCVQILHSHIDRSLMHTILQFHFYLLLIQSVFVWVWIRICWYSFEGIFSRWRKGNILCLMS